jgi:hypothetical protein
MHLFGHTVSLRVTRYRYTLPFHATVSRYRFSLPLHIARYTPLRAHKASLHPPFSASTLHRPCRLLCIHPSIPPMHRPISSAGPSPALVHLQRWSISSAGPSPALVHLQRWSISSAGLSPALVYLQRWSISSAGLSPALVHLQRWSISSAGPSPALVCIAALCPPHVRREERAPLSWARPSRTRDSPLLIATSI